MREWKPIETAPKDGTFIVMTDGTPAWPWVARWTNDDSMGEPFTAGWETAIGGRIKTATHWMPLPEPPQ